MKKIVLFDIDHTLFDTLAFKKSNLQNFVLYEEVKHVLDELSPIAELGIFSEGDVLLQTKKLEETGIYSAFIKEQIHIFVRKIEGIKQVFGSRKKDQVYLIDDKAEILSEVKKAVPTVRTIWIRRGIYKDILIPGFQPDHTITTLHEIIGYIKRETIK